MVAGSRSLRRDRHRQPLRRHPHRPRRARSRAGSAAPRRRTSTRPGPARACSSRSTARRPTSPAPARPTPGPRSISAAMMCDFLGEADASARDPERRRQDGRCQRHDRPDRRRDRRRLLTPSRPKGVRVMPITPTEKIWMNGELVAWDDAQDPRAHPHPALRHAACSKASAPTRPTTAPRCSASPTTSSGCSTRRRSCMMDIPYTVDADRRRGEGDRARDRPAVVLHPADRVLRLRRDGAQHAAVRGRRVDRGAGRGARTSATTRLSKGVRMKISSWRATTTTRCRPRRRRTGNYMNSSLAKVEALKAGYDEAIMLNPDGLRVASARARTSSSCARGMLITPPVVGGRAARASRRTRSRRSRATTASRCGSTNLVAQRPVHRRGDVRVRAPRPRSSAVSSVDDRAIPCPGRDDEGDRRRVRPGRARPGRQVQGMV